MSEPQTDAGRLLLGQLTDPDWEAGMLAGVARSSILRIEAEAIAAERERIVGAVEGLPKWDKRSVPGGWHVNRAAVLAIVRDEVTP